MGCRNKYTIIIIIIIIIIINTALRKLISEFTTPILNHNQVFFMSTMRKRFLEILADESVDHPQTYSPEHLKRQVLKEWPPVAFIPQSDKSDLVCCSNTTVGMHAHGLRAVTGVERSS